MVNRVRQYYKPVELTNQYADDDDNEKGEANAGEEEKIRCELKIGDFHVPNEVGL